MTANVKTPQAQRIGNALAVLYARIGEVSKSDEWEATREEVFRLMKQVEVKLESYFEREVEDKE